MTIIEFGIENDLMFNVIIITGLIIQSGFLFGILSSLLVNDRKNGYVLIVVLALGIISGLIVVFKNQTILGIVASIIFLTFIIMTYFSVRKKLKNISK